MNNSCLLSMSCPIHLSWWQDTLPDISIPDSIQMMSLLSGNFHWLPLISEECVLPKSPNNNFCNGQTSRSFDHLRKNNQCRKLISSRHDQEQRPKLLFISSCLLVVVLAFKNIIPIRNMQTILRMVRLRLMMPRAADSMSIRQLCTGSYLLSMNGVQFKSPIVEIEMVVWKTWGYKLTMNSFWNEKSDF